MACNSSEYFNGVDGKCYPIKSAAASEKKYDGSTSVWGYVPDGIQALSSLVLAFKNTPNQPTTNVYQTGGSGLTGGGSSLWLILGVLVFIIIIIAVVMRSRSSAA